MRRSLGQPSCDRVPVWAGVAWSVVLLFADPCPSALSQPSDRPRLLVVDTTSTGVISGTPVPDEIIV